MGNNLFAELLGLGISSSEMKPFVLPKQSFRKNVSISFSGGKTSAYMTKMLIDYFRENDPTRQVEVTFANTGQEHEETLKFIERCDRTFGFGVVWLEAVVNPERGKGIRHRIVNFDTASRNGEPFEAYIKKYGIPNAAYKQCNGRLKTDVMDSYRRSLGWKKREISTAVGIRADEIDRVSLSAIKNHGVFYPCVDAGVTKDDVRQWWAAQDFNLNIPEHYGNCVTCWKKSHRKLLTIARENPEAFDFFDRMERENAFAGPRVRRDGRLNTGPRVFFRKNKTAQDILRESAEGNFTPFEDDKFIPFDADLDVGGACGDSCEIYSDQD